MQQLYKILYCFSLKMITRLNKHICWHLEMIWRVVVAVVMCTYLFRVVYTYLHFLEVHICVVECCHYLTLGVAAVKLRNKASVYDICILLQVVLAICWLLFYVNGIC